MKDAARAVVGLRPSFSSHVRLGERGAPVIPSDDAENPAFNPRDLTLPLFQRRIEKVRE